MWSVCIAFTKKMITKTEDYLLTRQSSLFKRERQGDSPCVIANRLTCQRALCNRRKRQGSSQHATVTDGLAQRCKNVFNAKRIYRATIEQLSKLIKTATINVKQLKSKVKLLNTCENQK